MTNETKDKKSMIWNEESVPTEEKGRTTYEWTMYQDV